MWVLFLFILLIILTDNINIISIHEKGLFICVTYLYNNLAEFNVLEHFAVVLHVYILNLILCVDFIPLKVLKQQQHSIINVKNTWECSVILKFVFIFACEQTSVAERDW